MIGRQVMTDKDFKSKLENCYIVPRTDQEKSGPMFWQDAEGRAIANLDGYAIVPIEWLNRGMIQRAEDAPDNKTGFACLEVLSTEEELRAVLYSCISGENVNNSIDSDVDVAMDAIEEYVKAKEKSFRSECITKALQATSRTNFIQNLKLEVASDD